MAVSVNTHTLKENSYSIPNNTSSVTYLVKLTTSGSSYNNESITTTYYINGTKYTNKHTLPSNTTTTIVNKTVTVAHNSDGSKTVSASFSCPTDISAGTITGSKSLTLTKIPRYATSTQSVTSKDETSITMKWSSNATCDYIWYSTNNGSNWTAVGSVNGTSGSYTIRNLTPGTTYNIKTRVRRKDSQLTTDSANLAVAPYNYPYCSEAPTFTIGDDVTLKFYNPLNRTIRIQLWSHVSETFVSDLVELNGIEFTGFSDITDRLYESIPNNIESKYNVDVWYNDHKDTKNYGNTYKVRSDDTPEFIRTDWTYTTDLQELLHDTLAIIDDYSTITANITTAARPKHYASISSYTLKWGSSNINFSDMQGSLHGGNGNVLDLFAIDSRGLSTQSTEVLDTSKYITYFTPIVDNISADRDGGINAKTILSLNGRIRGGSFGANGEINTIHSASYRVLDSEDTWSEWYNIPVSRFSIDTETGSYSLSDFLIHQNGSSGGFTVGERYTIEVKIKDALGLLGETIATTSIADGKLARDVFQDTNGNYHQGINGLASEEYTQVIHGDANIMGAIYLENNLIIWYEEDTQE